MKELILLYIEDIFNQIESTDLLLYSKEMVDLLLG